MKRTIFLVTVFASVCLFPHTSAQAMNLLRNYFKQYFTNYQPTTIRSYTLYGNGQNQPADYQAGLPYPYEHKGKVSRLMYAASPKLPEKKLMYSESNQSEVGYANARPVQEVQNNENHFRLNPSQMSQIPQLMFRTPAQERSEVNPSETNSKTGVATPDEAKADGIQSDNDNQKTLIPFDSFENRFGGDERSPEFSVQSSMSFHE